MLNVKINQEEALVEFFQLRQSTTVKIYKRRFEEYASTINDIAEEFLVRSFTNGLKEEIKIGVQMYKPSTMDQANGLALLQEMTLEALEKRSKNSVSSGEKERKSAEATCAPTVRSIVEESEPLVGIDNSEGVDGLMSWGDLKRQIQENCSSEDVVKYFRIEVKEVYLEESEFKNDDTEEKLQCSFERATNVESHDSSGNKECLEKVLVLKNHSISNNHHSPLRGHYSDRKFVDGGTQEQYGTWLSEQCVCQKKAQISDMVICTFQNCDDRTIKIWDPGKSFTIVVCISAALTSIWEQVSGTQNWGVQKHGFDADPNVGRGLIYMYGQLRFTDFAFKVFDKITDAHSAAQMVTTLSKFPDVSFVRVVFNKMPKKDPTARNGMKEGYAKLLQLSTTRYSFDLRIMKDIAGHSMTCGFHKMSVLALYDSASLYCSVPGRSFQDSVTYLANKKHTDRFCGVGENNLLKSFFAYKERGSNVAKIKVMEHKIPLNKKELTKHEENILPIESRCSSVTAPKTKLEVDLTEYVGKNEFVCDTVLNKEVSNHEVYRETVDPLVPVLFNRENMLCIWIMGTLEADNHTL